MKFKPQFAMTISSHFGSAKSNKNFPNRKRGQRKLERKRNHLNARVSFENFKLRSINFVMHNIKIPLRFYAAGNLPTKGVIPIFRGSRQIFCSKCAWQIC
ncbi:hypothetical protein QE152_g9861 [Popillia japonica]|uniref:Uncharacterized protein n=1 Tax=Popillia japonica TaxID=7064 RepID=A0AAW1LX83_POPJA